MEKGELKKVLKPLIKQCIKEVLYEEGALKNIVSEVVQGLSTGQQIFEKKEEKVPVKKKEFGNNSTRKFLLDQIGRESQKGIDLNINGIDIFENVKPLSSGGKAGSEASPSSPLSDIDSHDPGVDISRIPGANNWSALIK